MKMKSDVQPERGMRAPTNERLVERVRELQVEVAQIAAAHRAEMPYRKGELEKRLRYEERLHRLQDIKEELGGLLKRAE
jgi:hypothetical protein